jgi:hypothetical protein
MRAWRACTDPGEVDVVIGVAVVDAHAVLSPRHVMREPRHVPVLRHQRVVVEVLHAVLLPPLVVDLVLHANPADVPP